MSDEYVAVLRSMLRSTSIAFAVSVVWEFSHAPLYGAYQGGAITSWILVRASFWDALMLVAIALLSGMMKKDAKGCNVLAGAVLALMVAFNLELYALSTARWVYTTAMPTLPFFGVGLSPLLQLPISLIVVWKLSTVSKKS